LLQTGICQAELLHTEVERNLMRPYQAGTNSNGKCNRENNDSQDKVFMATFKMRVSRKVFRFLTVDLVDILQLYKGLFKVEKIIESITGGNGKGMLATNVESLKYWNIQQSIYGLNTTLKKLKFLPELWINLFSIDKAIKNGYHLCNQGLSIFLSKGSISINLKESYIQQMALI
jgi:hypothetical protein